MHHSDPTDQHPIAATAAPAAAPVTQVSTPDRVGGTGVTVLDTLAPWAGGIGATALILAVVLVLAHRIVGRVTQLVERLRSRSERNLGRRPTRDHPVVPVALLTGLGATLTTWLASGTAGAVTDSGSQRVEPVAPTSVPLLTFADDPDTDDRAGSPQPAAPPGTGTGPGPVPATPPGTPTTPDTPVPPPPAPSTPPLPPEPPAAGPLPGASVPGTPATPPTTSSVAGGTAAGSIRTVGPPPAPSGGDPGGGGGGQRSTHTVQAGEHLWGIASGRLRFVTGTPPEDRAVVDYWLRLIEANLDRLPDPDDPDLIHPGLVLVLPEPGPIDVTSR